VETPPSEAVVLAMGCGPLCGGKLDVSRVLRDAAGKGWTTLSVPLGCLRAAGTDLTNVSTPFALTTSGKLGLSLLAVKIARTGDAVSCASVPPVTAATVVTSPSPKKKAASVHERKKRSPSSHRMRRRR